MPIRLPFFIERDRVVEWDRKNLKLILEGECEKLLVRHFPMGIILVVDG